MEVVDIDPDPEEVPDEVCGDIEIALLGSFNPRTIHMKGVIRGKSLTVLIDSGSTHNFIQ